MNLVTAESTNMKASHRNESSAETVASRERRAGQVQAHRRRKSARSRSSSRSPAVPLVLAFALLSLVAAFIVGTGLAQAQVVQTSAFATNDLPAGRISLGVGLHGTRIGSAAYGPFSQNKGLTETDFTAFWRAVSEQRQALYLGVAAGWGLTESMARSSPSHLDTMRLEVTAQSLHAFRPYLYGVGRLGVGALHWNASLGEATGTYRREAWAPTGSAMVGLAFRVSAKSLDFWFVLEGGYRYAPTHRLALAHEAKDQGTTRDTIDLGNLSLSGPAFGTRLGLFF